MTTSGLTVLSPPDFVLTIDRVTLREKIGAMAATPFSQGHSSNPYRRPNFSHLYQPGPTKHKNPTGTDAKAG